ncbi:macrolide 2'-phosphotransferase [Mesobacillus maritimus]|uniref:Macrolide 2'-phosphotransferase n=1 Tax=Mesobacillus maritimus TaxID=1643336 RepID=A0ABS7K823_9BACI|nr:macrolide 2'-phosphotransferase [Mesobacillus maritimus]MBY0098424.1 macrolide 2'-phosphotransferase [Mesobacillus maritimus]
MDLTNDQIIELSKSHGLVLKEDSLSRNESGLDFLVVMAAEENGEQWVLRIPRRPDVITTARKEKKILELLKGKLHIQTPQWDVFSDGLIAYKLLDGVPTGTIDPDAKAYVWEIDEKNVPDSFNETLGNALADLHSISHLEAERAGLSVLAPEQLRDSMRERMKKVKDEYGVGEELWSRWQEWLENEELWPKESAFIHGDLHAGHILINEGACVTGFIDWTEARVDDPAHDFVVHFTAFGDEALESLIESYRVAGGYVWPYMREHIHELTASYPVAIAEFAKKSGLEEFELMAKQMLGVMD